MDREPRDKDDEEGVGNWKEEFTAEVAKSDEKTGLSFRRVDQELQPAG